jgi:hypothetical protein
MDRYHYPITTLYPDYARVAVGMVATLGPLFGLDVAPGIAVVLCAFAVLFAWFGVRTALRQASWVELSPETIALRGPFDRRLAWQQLDRLKLAYFAPRRARKDGWLQLTLRGGARTRPIRVDSTLDGFDRVLQHAVGVAGARAVSLDPTTQANLAALGLGRGDERSSPVAASSGADRRVQEGR